MRAGRARDLTRFSPGIKVGTLPTFNFEIWRTLLHLKNEYKSGECPYFNIAGTMTAARCYTARPSCRAGMGLYMRALLCAIMITAAGVIPAAAHPPSAVNATYITATRVLHLVIVHPVSNPETHYIEKVEVFRNDQLIIEQIITRQDNENEQYLCFRLPDIDNADTIRVKAHCSISGSYDTEIRFTYQ